jgi:catechol 2,3-dioxygenase-like lactoylglutathione lyase family enzyme
MSNIRKLRVQIRAIVVSRQHLCPIWSGRSEAKELRGVYTRLRHGPSAPVLDLVQFIDPLTQGQPYPILNNIGICRIAFSVDDIDRTYADLQAKEVQFVGPIKKIKRPDGATSGAVCFKDPDGAILELVSGL